MLDEIQEDKETWKLKPTYELGTQAMDAQADPPLSTSTVGAFEVVSAALLHQGSCHVLSSVDRRTLSRIDGSLPPLHLPLLLSSVR